MSFEWFAIEFPLALDTTLSVPALIVALLYALLTLWFLSRSRADFRALTPRRWMLLAALLLLVPPLALAARLTLSVDIPFSASQIAIPLLGMLPLLAAAIWLGQGPAVLVGLATGLTWTLAGSGRLTQPFETALLASAVGALLNQPYRDAPATWLRQPLVAMLLGVIFVWFPLTLLGLFASHDAVNLSALERTLTALAPAFVEGLAPGLVAGLIVQALVAWRPGWRRVQERDLQAAPWHRHLSQRMLYALVPLSVLAILALLAVVWATSYRVATQLVVDQMARDAENAASSVPFFVQVGRSLIRDLAGDSALQSPNRDRAALEARLEEGLHAVPFYERLIYFDAAGEVVAAYPPLEEQPALSPEELSAIDLAVQEKVPAEVVVETAESDPQTAESFIAPVVDPQTGQPIGALLGRTTLRNNPILVPVVDILETGFVGSGEGFIVDEQNHILLYPNQPERQQQTFSLGRATELLGSAPRGQAFRQQEADGAHTLIYVLPVEGQSGWSVVVTLPNEVALALAAQIAFPMLLLLLVMAAVAFPLVVAVMRGITDPLGRLLAAVDSLGQGELDHPVGVAGEDEIGRLGAAFEQMRLRLSSRLDELERLLRVSRSVSSSLELFRSMPPILSSALEATTALGVRMVVRRSAQEPLQQYSAGAAAAVIAPLDGQLLELVERQGTVVISQLWRASGSLDTTALPPWVKALVAFPLRSDTSFHGILWLAYDHDHEFEQSEMTFLSTLAGQAAVAVANARLFGEAQEERRKLEAVLESTADAMIVADNQGRIVLLNPSAEKYLGVRGDEVRGRPAAQIIGSPELAHLLTSLQEPVSMREMSGDRGRPLLASVSTIVGHDGVITGRVAVMRDITALKELDNIKTVFLRMVSHDLRSPLTYMRGYLSMLPLTGELNERQAESLQKISNGIDSISDLTERLLYLSRLQFGDEAQLEFTMVDVESLINQVAVEQESAIRQRSVSLKLEVEEKLPLLAADEMLYRQAISNLLTNALKYTPEGGEVTVRASRAGSDGGSAITISVTDTGIGIRDEDQSRLFEAFYRVPQREGEPQRPRGSGLGLALVKAIANAHGGTVGFHSVFGEGSTFEITLPVRGPDEI